MKNDIMIDTSHITGAMKGLKSIADAMETYKSVSNVAISDSVKEISKAFSGYSQLKYSDSLKGFRTAMELYTKMNISYLTKDLYLDEMRKSIREFSKVAMVYQRVNVNESFKAIRESVNAVFQGFTSEQIEQFRQINYSAMFVDILPKTTSISDIVETAYVRIEGEEECDLNDSFTEEEIQEILQEQVEMPLKFQERVSNWSEKKKKEYYIVFMLIVFLYSTFVQPYIQEYIGKPVMTYVVSNVKELPQKGAEVIGKIKENMEAIITENTNYYYKVIYIDENGETKEGYVAKRNLKIIDEEPEGEEVLSTEGEATDLSEE